MSHETQLNMVKEVIAKQYEAIREVAARNCICEKTLSKLCNDFVSAGCREIGPPGIFNVSGATCNGTTVTITGNASTTEPGEEFIGIHAVLVESGAPTPSIPGGAPEFEDFPVELEADGGFDGDVVVWGVFTTTTTTELGPIREELSSPCDEGE